MSADAVPVSTSAGSPAVPVKSSSPLDVVRAYVALTKPRIIEQLLITTVPAMMLAAGGLGSPLLIVLTLVGGMLSAGSANSLNCYVDRDIDSVMHRTARRPLVRHTVAPRAALVFGLVLGVLSTAIFWFFTTPLATGLNLLAILLYVVLYTMVLKRRTSQNIVWGGAAGCMPVLIGWAAVTGSLSLAPFIMFAIIFFWTPPHFWALAIKYKDDYAAAGVPMLPVVAKPSTVTAQMLAHAVAMVACSIALWPVATSAVYGVIVSILGAWFLFETVRLHVRTVRGAEIKPMRVFHMSNTYLSLVFVLIAVDALLF
ncbi:protoheme IX farnesyltransferase [Epidermidibacterium keratini]|uniref:Protoheme IX farnesyltransferase n=1 Tax=Epidermidibacterium keratini TaxID=1891644 RepID=A0A7L4YSP8_9ACTN|nr:heme o synthase [Epidermidibacterium keratini]QHC02120.1 protoheme IX farnesyltransferase [Epidermidibacterium keratini]